MSQSFWTKWVTGEKGQNKRYMVTPEDVDPERGAIVFQGESIRIIGWRTSDIGAPLLRWEIQDRNALGEAYWSPCLPSQVESFIQGLTDTSSTWEDSRETILETVIQRWRLLKDIAESIIKFLS